MRRFMLLLLLILQGFAPLLHAHVQLHGVATGVHMHGFNIPIFQGVEVHAQDAADNCQAIIDIKLAISAQKVLNSEVERSHSSLRAPDLIAPHARENYHELVTIRSVFIPSTRFSTQIPRAPPL